MHAAYTIIQRTPLGAWFGGGIMLLFAFGLLLLPWWAPAMAKRMSEQRLRLAGVAIFVAWVALSVAGTFLDRG
jgi:hypothetical protein